MCETSQFILHYTRKSTSMDKFGNLLQIPVELNTEFAGLVEAWAAGVTWKELMDDSEMDEGDVARLLRRSIDLLAQVKSRMTNLSIQIP